MCNDSVGLVVNGALGEPAPHKCGRDQCDYDRKDDDEARPSCTAFIDIDHLPHAGSVSNEQ
jgi:hypothetical protein